MEWPALAQQAYVLGAVDQSLAAAYYYERELYGIVVKCMESTGTEAMFVFLIDYIQQYKYDGPVIDVVGDGVADFCQERGFEWPD
ncbi:MAG TPA: hypothetical protein VF275_11470 [Gammaproteobacteria bacterium]